MQEHRDGCPLMHVIGRFGIRIIQRDIVRHCAVRFWSGKYCVFSVAGLMAICLFIYLKRHHSHKQINFYSGGLFSLIFFFFFTPKEHIRRRCSCYEKHYTRQATKRVAHLNATASCWLSIVVCDREICHSF